jgi:hypothetical protein
MCSLKITRDAAAKRQRPQGIKRTRDDGTAKEEEEEEVLK